MSQNLEPDTTDRRLFLYATEVDMAEEKLNQGEGNRAADKRYRKKSRDFAQSGEVSEAAEKARDAVDGEEQDALKRAEEAGKKKARR